MLSMWLSRFVHVVSLFATVIASTHGIERQSLPPIIYIPGFEGSLLASSSVDRYPSSITRIVITVRNLLVRLGIPVLPGQRRLVHGNPEPIFLAPTSAAAFPTLIARLSEVYKPNTGTHAPPRDLSHQILAPYPDSLAAVDYPVAACAPPPYSRIAHCVPIPAPGPFAALTAVLTSRYNYTAGETLLAAPYDWRLPPHAILDARTSPWPNLLRGLIDDANGASILVAHGYGCVLASRFLASSPPAWSAIFVSHLYCLSPTNGGGAAASVAMQLISGHVPPVTPPRTLHSTDAIPSPRKRLDFRHIEFTLGLRRARNDAPLPSVAGPWDDVARCKSSRHLATAMPGAAQLARTYGSLVSMLHVPVRDKDSLRIQSGNNSLVRISDVSYGVGVKWQRRLALDGLNDIIFAARIDKLLVREVIIATEVQANVLTTCVYGSGIDTPETLLYAGGTAGKKTSPPSVTWSSGDGVVAAKNAASYCNHLSRAQKDKAVTIRDLPGTTHFDLDALAVPLYNDLDQLSFRIV
jgi:hypothetical protein